MGYTYQLLMAKLSGRCENSRKLANNTWLERIEGGIAIRLHQTRILTFNSNGDVTIDTGGWMTVTTRARLNDYLPVPWQIRQIARVWYIGTVDGGWKPTEQRAVFVDGCTITHTGKIIGAKVLDTDKRLIKRKDLERRRIKGFCSAYMTKLGAGEVPPPSGGDCFYCSMVGENGETMGGRDHLISHLKESYYVPSLLIRAITPPPSIPNARIVSDMTKAWLSDRWHANENKLLGTSWEHVALRQLEQALVKYMFKNLGFGA